MKFKNKYIADRAFYKRYIMIALPMIVQSFITNFVSLLDNIMVGQLGTEQMTGVAIINQLNFVYFLAVFGVAGAASIFGAQYFGKGDHEGHMYTFRFRIISIALCSILAAIIFITLGEKLISLYMTSGDGSAELTMAYAKEYLAIVMVGMIPFALTNIYASVVRETGQTFITMVAGLCSVGVNAVLDYLFIFGIGPIPAMGVSGAAWATVVARVVEAAIVIVWAHKNYEKNKWLQGAYKSIKIPVEIWKPILIKGTPLMFNEILWASGMTALTQSYSFRGLDVVAANNIANTINNLFNIVFIQLGACISIIVGQYLGAGHLKEAKDADNKMIFFSMAATVVMAALMLAVGRFFPQIYNTSDEIKGLATSFITVQALVMPFCAFSHCSYFTLRSGGKTFVTFLFDSGFTWVIMVPCCFILTHFTSLGIVSIFFIVSFTELIKNVVGYIMLKSNVWLNQMV